MKVKVIYKGLPQKAFDDKVTRIMKKINCKWQGQGYTFQTDERDICFEHTVKNKLYNIAERMDYYNKFPEKFWKNILRYYNKKAGFLK